MQDMLERIQEYIFKSIFLSSNKCPCSSVVERRSRNHQHLTSKAKVVSSTLIRGLFVILISIYLYSSYTQNSITLVKTLFPNKTINYKLSLFIVIFVAIVAVIAMVYNIPNLVSETDLSGKAPQALISVKWCQKDDNSNYFAKGTLTYAKSTALKLKEKIYTYSDFCSSNTLTEYSCTDGNKISRANIQCQYSCKEGACTPKAIECSDSDGGADLTKLGKVTGAFSYAPYEQVDAEDTCSSTYQVVEWYCDNGFINALDSSYINGELGSSGTTCPNDTFCKDGACIPPSCDYYPFKENSICEGNMLIDCKTGKKTDCSSLHGYLNQKKCGQKFQAAADECLEPCLPGSGVYICANGFNKITYWKLSCLQEKYGWFGWKWDNVLSCPSGTKCGAWITGDNFDYSVCS